MWELDHKEDWMPKNWCFQIVVLEQTLESPLDSKEIKPVNPKRNQSWLFIGRTVAEAEAPILWPLDAKSWLTGKDPHAGNDRGQEKGVTDYEMVGWHPWLNGCESEQTPGDSEGQGGSLECCSPWGLKESGTTERLHWTVRLLLFLQQVKLRFRLVTDFSSCKWHSLEAKPRPMGSKPHGLSQQPSASSGRLFCAGLLAL